MGAPTVACVALSGIASRKLGPVPVNAVAIWSCSAAPNVYPAALPTVAPLGVLERARPPAPPTPLEIIGKISPETSIASFSDRPNSSVAFHLPDSSFTNCIGEPRTFKVLMFSGPNLSARYLALLSSVLNARPNLVSESNPDSRSTSASRSVEIPDLSF